MGCALIIGGLFKGIWNVIHWCFTNGVKGFAVLAVIIIVIVIGVNMIKNTVTPAKPAVAGAQTVDLPSIKSAPYLVKTASRHYYAKTVETDAVTGATTLTDYWELVDNKWLKGKILVLDKTFGKVTVSKR